MEEKTLLNATICFLKKEKRILLAFKTEKICTEKIGKDFWNGYGGGIENGEDAKAGAVREIEEEAGVSVLPENLEEIAIVDFHNTKSDGSTFICRCHIYLVHKWTGEVKETDTMIKPTWFDIGRLPYDQMMPTDKDFLPLALNGKKLRAKAYLGPFQKEKLKDTEIEFVESFNGD